MKPFPKMPHLYASESSDVAKGEWGVKTLH